MLGLLEYVEIKILHIVLIQNTHQTSHIAIPLGV